MSLVLPRVSLGHGPTPLEKLPNLGAELGIELYIKRDDCTGLALGGNKTRKLEYLVAAALEEGADTLVTLGGIQSNHARQTAAAAARFGLGCELLLEDVPGTPKLDYYRNGNLLLDHLCGARVRVVDEGSDLTLCAEQLMRQLREAGKRPYLIPVGGSNEVGSLGYMRCTEEIIQQAAEQGIAFDHWLVATGSGGTQAGLLAGQLSAGDDTPLLGFCVSRSAELQEALVGELLERTLKRLGIPLRDGASRVRANGDYVGAGYGIPGEDTLEAVRLAASREAILLDPVYTGKAMAGLIDHCRRGLIAPGSRVLFIHTGGAAGLFAYSDSFQPG
ncbi:D-cysteine desulfhydrase [Aestuariirhabdus litorea]|uniref:D-cysteine desulfhydrase n=1 Tax=Aestuariirhabdus litorea TaxID=2528527 RepID=A0A3P3VM80_9GAMM|nr:D-cysteine desulfhydrase [Aestuariirhabdus litorea]RRJ82766.1 D-cysteine desulfhydrase [Aestuariirhabdus litorea]RWW92926.1 D-cysteine desulfhydrase [Endozoicomonadaceae bacterium GTF-13]